MTAHSPRLASPAEIAITPRDLRFGRSGRPDTRRDPVGTAWFLALSSSFPRGEAMFIEAVKAFREGAPPRLEAEIRAFIKQEVNHSREHLAFNRAAAEAGFDLTAILERVDTMADESLSKPRLITLAVTIALEHFTAAFAHLFLTDPDSLVTEGVGDRDLWRWHAIEEIEHKGVAFDTWLHATRDWKPRKRWLVRNLVMLQVTRRFFSNRLRDSLELLAQQGITGWTARRRLAAYLLWQPGMLRRFIPAWLSYFRPGFHPWDHDDRALIGRFDSDYADARMLAVAAE